MSLFTLLIAGAAAVLFGFGSGWTANGWRLNAEIARITAQHADEKTRSTSAALDDFKKTADSIASAADRYANAQANLGDKLDRIRKDLKNAKPLPVDCKPDDVRVRNLADAIRAANEAAAGPKPVATVPANSDAGR